MFIPGGLVADATRTVARSALPDAPVVDDDTTPTAARLRLSLATALRGVATRATRAAERVEPRYALGSCDRTLRARG